MAYKVFISHSSRDTRVAKQIEEHIKLTGADTFLDERDVQIGDVFATVIRRELNTTDELLVLLTPWALKRAWIELEIGVVWGREKRVIAVLHGITLQEFQQESQIPSVIKENDIVDINELGQYFSELELRVAGR
ncbi:MAG: toll/interleukin-1 receptor domain-containing protein [Saprospiraceae bacterium]